MVAPSTGSVSVNLRVFLVGPPVFWSAFCARATAAITKRARTVAVTAILLCMTSPLQTQHQNEFCARHGVRVMTRLNQFRPPDAHFRRFSPEFDGVRGDPGSEVELRSN